MELIQSLFQCLTGTASRQTVHALETLFGVVGILVTVYVLSVWLDKKPRREPPDHSAEEQGWFHPPERHEEEKTGIWPPAPRKHDH